MLFLQHGLIYRDFTNAMRYGDSGRIKNCLTFFMLWFQGSQFSNYAGELLHLIACLNHVWPKEHREHWFQNVLVNISGSKKGFMPGDLVGELVVREIKSWQTATATGAGGEYLRTVMAPQVLFCSRIRDAISREIGTTRHYKHSSSVTAWFDVRTVADKLLKDRVFTFIPIRQSAAASSSNISEVCDLYSRGVGQIWAGRVIDRYVDKRQAGFNYGLDLTEDIEGEDGPLAMEIDELEEGEDDEDVMDELMEGFF